MNIRMRPIRRRDDFENVKDTDECFYIGFRPSSKDLIKLIDSAPMLKVIYIPESYTKTLSQSMIMLLDMKNIQLIVGGIQSGQNVESCFMLNDVNLPDGKEPESVDETTEGTSGEESEPVMTLDKNENNEKYGNVGQTGELD